MTIKFFLFVLGAAFGSFINVLDLRYKPDRFLFGKQIFGRSRCPHCGKELGPHELIPILSFIFQGGRCSRCRSRISLQYPLIEFLSGLVFIFAPLKLYSVLYDMYSWSFYLISSAWLAIFLLLILVALIDFRLGIIPDEINVLLLLLGLAITWAMKNADVFQRSFLSGYALLFGFGGNIWINRLVAAFAVGAVFAFIIFVSRGRGMGMGDLKLVIPLGFIFGWPDIVLVAGLAFIIGSLAGLFVIVLSGRTLKSAIPFGPFIVISSFLVFFLGKEIVDFYFRLFP